MVTLYDQLDKELRDKLFPPESRGQKKAREKREAEAQLEAERTRREIGPVLLSMDEFARLVRAVNKEG